MSGATPCSLTETRNTDMRTSHFEYKIRNVELFCDPPWKLQIFKALLKSQICLAKFVLHAKLM